VVKAKDGKLTPNEMSGSTFSISNMGMLGVENFAAIINGPNSAILAVSTAKKTVVVTADDELEVRTMMKMTASFDHRVIDGAEGAKFINIVKSYLENPTRLLS
jgi:pyruvate dehydrogenase E2 component (dihydrolipoamide acetyltransferase)